MKYCKKCGTKLLDEDKFCTECGYNTEQKKVVLEADNSINTHNTRTYNTVTPPNRNNVNKPSTKWTIIIMVALAIFTLFGIYIIYREQINIQVSNLLSAGITVSIEAQIPNDETDEQISDNMKKIAAITKHRLTFLGYSDASVGIDKNTIIIKHLPKNADIDTITKYIESSTYIAEFKDADGNTVMSSSDFISATATSGEDADTFYKISIQLSTETREAFSDKIKAIAALDDDKNYIYLITNGITIIKLYIMPEHIETGWQSNDLSFNVPNNDLQYNLSPEELEKALNSNGTMPYSLKTLMISGTDSTQSNNEVISRPNVPQIDLQKSLGEGKSLIEVFNSVDGTNHYNYVMVNSGKYELWVKGDKRKLISTIDGSSAIYYNYGNTYYQYMDGVAVEDNVAAPMVFDMYPIDAWEYTRTFFNENKDAEFEDIGSDNVNGESCTVFNVLYTNQNTEITYRTARIYISNNFGCIAKCVSISGDSENQVMVSAGVDPVEVTENTIVEYYDLAANIFVDSDVVMPANTQFIDNPFK